MNVNANVILKHQTAVYLANFVFDSLFMLDFDEMLFESDFKFSAMAFCICNVQH